MNTEQKIFAAFRKAASLSTSGTQPTSALATAAIDGDLNHEMTKRAGEMLNIFLTHKFMKEAQDKTASFPTADIPESLKLAFIGHNAIQPPANNRPASGYRTAKKASAAGGERLSFIGDAKVEPYQSHEMSDLVKHAQGCVKIAQAKAEKARLDFEQVKHATFSHFKSLVEFFQRPSNIGKFANFERQVMGEYGAGAASTIDLVAQQLPGVMRLPAEDMPKRAEYFVPGTENTLFDRVMDGMGQIASLNAAWKTAADEYQSMAEQVEGLYFKCAAGKDGKDGKGGSFEKAVGGAANETAGALISKGPGLIASHLKSQGARYLPTELGGTGPAAAAVDKAEGDAYSKAHSHAIEQQYKRPIDEADLEMDNLRRATILRNIMTNDEIVSALDPVLVQGAYNGLLQMSPESTLNQAMVTSYLRQAGSQQALDPFTAKQLADLSKVQLENKNLRDGKPAAK